MRYSFMPWRCYKINAPYYFESDSNFLMFRNQYNRSYMFAPRNVLRVLFFVTFVLGCFTGRFISLILQSM